jgi:hypothetical protein
MVSFMLRPLYPLKRAAYVYRIEGRAGLDAAEKIIFST